MTLKILSYEEIQIEKCIKELSKGNKQYIETLYNLTKTSIYSYALSILKNKDDAEDVLQELYINVYNNASKYKSIGKPMQWLITITRNLCYMEFRKKKNTIEISEVAEILPDNMNLNIDDKILIEVIFKMFTDEEREIVTLYLISGFKHREIAGILGMPLSTVLSKYNRAIKKIKERMKEGNYKNERE